jgi:hypothetical protein
MRIFRALDQAVSATASLMHYPEALGSAKTDQAIEVLKTISSIDRSIPVSTQYFASFLGWIL